MRLYLHYEETEDKAAHKTLKLTLPKLWRTGPTFKILQQFVESYNQSLPSCPALDTSLLHLALFRISATAPAQERTTKAHNEDGGILDPIPYDAITDKALRDQDHVYVCIGPSQTMEALGKSYKKEEPVATSSSVVVQSTAGTTIADEIQLVRCTNFGCKVRFPRGSLDTPKPCIHHAGPPVFHETAKFWSCCPQKRAYDWDDFESIPGCVVDEAGCTEISKTNTRNFLGGCDLRAEMGEKTNKLKSIEEFNQSQRAAVQGSSTKIDSDTMNVGDKIDKSLMTQLKETLIQMGIETELYDQVVEGIRKQLIRTESLMDTDDSVVLEKALVEEMGSKLKKAFKAMAVEQLRIK